MSEDVVVDEMAVLVPVAAFVPDAEDEAGIVVTAPEGKL